MFHTDHFSFSQSNPVSVLAAQSVDPPVQPTQKRRRRPPSNPTSIPTSAAEPKRRGRPPGSKNKPKDDSTLGTGRGRGGRGRGRGEFFPFRGDRCSVGEVIRIHSFTIISYIFLIRRRRISPPRAPQPVPCRSSRCNHLVIFDSHFNKILWNDYLELTRQYNEQRQENDNEEL